MATAARSEENFRCSICLELLTEPVSTPCGHNFCRQCLSQYWDTRAPCRCPLCNELFYTTPELRVNLLLSEVVSELRQETGSNLLPSSSENEVSDAGEVSKAGEVFKAREVSCDHCSAPKLKAVKSCLLCLSSFCESHLQPHLNLPGLKSHQLMEPVENMEDRLCPQHHKPLELFCSSDNTLLCTMCVLEHQSHKFVSLKEEFEQRKLFQQQTQSQDTLKQKRQKIQELQSSVQLSQRAMDREKSTGLQAFNALLEFVQRSRYSFIHDLQDIQKNIETQAEALIRRLKQDICELEKRDAEDHLLYLQRCPALPPTDLEDCSSMRLDLYTFEGSAARTLCQLQQRLRDIFNEHMEKLTPTGYTKEQELKRVQRFAVDLTLDPDSAHVELSVSKDLKQVHHKGQINFRQSPQRFSYYFNIVTRQSFYRNFYFEVQVKDKTGWTLGVASESVDRKKGVLKPKAGYWCIRLENMNECFALSDFRVRLSLKSAPQKVGVFVDYVEGLVSFYDVDTADLIHLFTHCRFRDKLFPLLNPGLFVCDRKDQVPLILSAVTKKSPRCKH